jgi:hypothetical protein
MPSWQHPLGKHPPCSLSCCVLACLPNLPGLAGQVEVALPGGRTVALPIFPTTTARDVTAYVAALLGKPADSLAVKRGDSAGQLLCGGLIEQGVLPGHQLTATVHGGGPQRAHTHATTCPAEAPAVHMLTHITNALSWRPNCQQTAAALCGRLAVVPAGPMQLFVNTLTGRRIQLHIRSLQTVHDVKLTLQEQIGGWVSRPAGQAGRCAGVPLASQHGRLP